MGAAENKKRVMEGGKGVRETARRRSGRRACMRNKAQTWRRGKSKRENCLGRGGKKRRAEETQTKSHDEEKKEPRVGINEDGWREMNGA